MASFGETPAGQLMGEYFRPSLVDFASTMRRIRGSNVIRPAEAISLPDGWSFQEENSQLQVAISRRDIHR